MLFQEALRNGDLETIIKIPKSDYHNHGTRGGRIGDVLPRQVLSKVKRLDTFNGIDEMQVWYDQTIKPYCQGQEGYIRRLGAAFKQAQRDGIKKLTLSLGLGDYQYFDYNINRWIKAIQILKDELAPDIDFYPEISFSRSQDPKRVLNDLNKLLEYKFFKSIDLTGDEALGVEHFKEVYKVAKEEGLVCKAHVGETSGPEAILKAVKVLRLDEVQHGIHAVESRKVMHYLKKHSIRLNVCPTSNVLLGNTKDMSIHPIAELYRYGIDVTINSDDLLIFDSSVSEEYMKLYNSGCLEADELDIIRRKSLDIK